MKTILLLAFLSTNALAGGVNLMMCDGEFALCAASASVPTGKTIRVDGKEFQEGMAVCPVLKAPPGKVWSLFSTVTEYPQAPSWAVVTMTPRTFVTTTAAGGGMSNQWSFLCDKQAKKVNNVQLANCFGPINESPWNNGHVPVGSTAFTAAPVGAANPVGGNVPSK